MAQSRTTQSLTPLTDTQYKLYSTLSYHHHRPPKYLSGVGLSNSEDWNARITSLHALQALAVGDGSEFDSLLGHLKASHELVDMFNDASVPYRNVKCEMCAFGFSVVCHTVSIG